MEEKRRFVGKVVTLNGQDLDKEWRPCGEVVFSIFDDEQNFKAKAWLNGDDYKKAYDAHYARADLVFEGRVVKNDRSAILSEVKNLRFVKELE